MTCLHSSARRTVLLVDARLDQSPDRESTDTPANAALDDLLETSKRLYHRLIAQEQVRLQEWIETEQGHVEAWRQNELQRPGANPEYLEFLVTEHLTKLRARVRENLNVFIERQTELKADRDWGIFLHFDKVDA